MTSQDRLKNLKDLLQQKTSQLQNIEQARGNLTQEIVQLQGKIQLMQELMAEEENKKAEVSNNKNNEQK